MRLIDEDAVISILKETGIIQDNDLGHLVVDEINRIPTAYDKEEVVAKLEQLKIEAMRKNYKRDILLDIAIDIVKGEI